MPMTPRCMRIATIFLKGSAKKQITASTTIETPRRDGNCVYFHLAGFGIDYSSNTHSFHSTASSGDQVREPDRLDTDGGAIDLEPLVEFAPSTPAGWDRKEKSNVKKFIVCACLFPLPKGFNSNGGFFCRCI
jgi:hypothetical protein